MNREETMARERATVHIEHQRREEEKKKKEQMARTAAINDRKAEAIGEQADKIRNQILSHKSWESHAKLKPLAVKAVKRMDKAVEELALSMSEVNKQLHALYHSAPKTDGTPYELSPLAPARVLSWMRLALFKVDPKAFRWITRTWQSPAEVKAFLEEAIPAVDWCESFKTEDKKPNISQESEEIF